MNNFDEFYDSDDSRSEIDIAGIISGLWAQRRKILKITGIFAAVGVFLALTLPPKFKASCVFVPQFSHGFGSKYASLASMAGLDMDLISSSESQINPKVYPMILEHPGFLLDLMHTPMNFEKADHQIDFYEYSTDKQYRKFNLIAFISKYTIGLPRLVLNAVIPEKEVMKIPVSEPSENGETVTHVYQMTKEEDDVAKALVGSIKLDVDAKKGCLTLTVTMPEAVASAQMCEAAYLTLKKYVGEFRRRKAADNLRYIDSQVEEAYQRYIEKQEQCARVMDSNMGSLTASAKMERIRKESEYNLANQMYGELARQQVSARIKLEESTVAFSEIAPAEVPLKRSSPKRVATVVGWAFLGFCAACAYVYFSGKRRDSESEKV